MVKVFTLNENGKIEITKEELERMLDESYWDGFWARYRSWTYESPNPIKITWDNPYVQNTPFTINTTSSNMTINAEDNKNNV